MSAFRSYSLLVLTCLAGRGAAAPPMMDDEALPSSATARLGTMRALLGEPLAHTFVDRGRTLVLVYEGPELVYRDVATGRLLQRWKLGHLEDCKVALSANGRVLAAITSEAITVWDTTSRAVIREFSDEDGYMAADLTGDGSRLLILTRQDLSVVDLRTGQSRPLAVVTERASSEFRLAGDYVLVNRPELRCIHLKGREQRWVSSGVKDLDQIHIVNGRLLLANAPSGAVGKPLDLSTGRPVAPFIHADVVTPSLFSRDGRLALSHDADEAKVREVANGKILGRTSGLVLPFDFTPDARSVLGTEGDGYLQRWDVATGRAQYPKPESPVHSSWVTWLAFSPDGRTLYSHGADDDHIRVWDLTTRRFRKALKISESEDPHFALMPGDKLIVAPYGGEAVVHDLKTEKPVRTIRLPESDEGRVVLPWLSGDGRRLMVMVSTKDKKTFQWSEHISVWDTETGKRLAERAEPEHKGWLALSRDGSLVASGADGVRDTLTGRARRALLAPAERVGSLAFSPDSAQLAMMTWEGEEDYLENHGVTIFEIRTGGRVSRLRDVRPIQIQFTLDKQRVLTVSTRRLDLWDVATGNRLKTWPIRGGPDGSLTNYMIGRVVAISPDGRQMAHGLEDGSIVLWPLPPAPAGK